MKNRLINFILKHTLYRVFWKYSLKLEVLTDPIQTNEGWEYKCRIRHAEWKHKFLDVVQTIVRPFDEESSFKEIKKRIC
mgnify:CR=1 FL=1